MSKSLIEALTDLDARLASASDTLTTLIETDTSLPKEVQDLEVSRLSGKREGVNLARSYVGETLRGLDHG